MCMEYKCLYLVRGNNFRLANQTHLDLRRKNFDLEEVFFFVFPFTMDDSATVLSIFSISHFNFALVALFDFDTPNNVLSLIFLLLPEPCSWFDCCFFDVVKFCKKQNITLRVISQSRTIRAIKRNCVVCPQNHPYSFKQIRWFGWLAYHWVDFA